MNVVDLASAAEATWSRKSLVLPLDPCLALLPPFISTSKVSQQTNCVFALTSTPLNQSLFPISVAWLSLSFFVPVEHTLLPATLSCILPKELRGRVHMRKIGTSFVAPPRMCFEDWIIDRHVSPFMVNLSLEGSTSWILRVQFALAMLR